MADNEILWGLLEFLWKVRTQKPMGKGSVSVHQMQVSGKKKTAHSVTLGTMTIEAEPVTAVSEKVGIKDMEETDPAMMVAGPEAVVSQISSKFIFAIQK